MIENIIAYQREYFEIINEFKKMKIHMMITYCY